MTVTEGIDWSQVDVTVPGRALQVPGIQMAGFDIHESAPVELAMIPHPSVTLLLDLTDNGITYDAAGRTQGDVVVGLLPADVHAASAGSGACLQIRLSPVVAAAVVGDPAVLGGGVSPLDALWGARAAAWADQLRAAPSWEERFALALRFLHDRAAQGRAVSPEVRFAWERTVRGRGGTRIEALATDTGWSRQRLWSRFRTQLGLSPKRAAQLVRFDLAAHLLAAGHSPATTAAVAGYADQPHLHREARAFAHAAPTAVAKAPWLAIDDVAWAPR